MIRDQLLKLHSLLAEPDELARSLVSRVYAEHEGERIAVGLFASAWEVYRGIRVLLERKLAEEARILWRTLVTDSALLMWFVTRKDEIDVLALRYHWTSAKHSRGIARAARDNGFEWAQEMFNERGKEIAHILREARAMGIEEPKNLPKPEELLAELKQNRLYYWHARASQTIHSTVIGLSARLRAPEKEGEAVGIPLEGPQDEIAQVGIMAAETFIAALAAASNLLGWDEQRVHQFGDGFSPRAEALYRSITGKPEPGREAGA
jgi:hypothetical protein